MEGCLLNGENLDLLTHLIWGSQVKIELFSRWSQGFIFSPDEKTALLQSNGGPCAVIAPVQAILLKSLIGNYNIQQLRQLDSVTVDQHLVSALVEIIIECQLSCHDAQTTKDLPNQLEQLVPSGLKRDSSVSSDAGPFVMTFLDNSNDENNLTDVTQCDAEDLIQFHKSVRLQRFESSHELHSFVEKNLMRWKSQFGILLFLYSVMLTKGVDRVRTEMGDMSESLIDETEGHGGQALTNLLVTGRASSYVWDGEKDVGGMRLVGIVKRPNVGFLTRLEHLRYVQVGWYLKNPTSPIWILASESHLTVLFSWTKSLVTPENELEHAKQVFSWHDHEGNHFIHREKLKPVLQELNLCSEDDFVNFMCCELDPEEMGVILYQKFMDTFFTSSDAYSPPDTFQVFHYNGLKSSCPEGKTQYAEGFATMQESHVKFMASNCEFLSCLCTRWPNLDIQWVEFTPSLN